MSFGNARYYCDDKGKLVTGKQKIAGKWYYFTGEEAIESTQYGISITGWIVDGDEKYYGLPDGSLRVGWLSFGNTYYYCGSEAAILKGAYEVDGVLYTSNQDGVMQKKSGWGSYGGNKYYFNPETGFPYTNQWVTFGEIKYYADSKGHMVSGWLKIGYYYYYFYPRSNIMAYNTTIGGYWVDSQGRRVGGSFLGTSRGDIVAELSQHEHDNYYIGTPYKGLDMNTLNYSEIGYPNGAPRWDGYSGFSCTGFVVSVFQKCGADLSVVGGQGRRGGVYNASNWWRYMKKNKTYYAFLSIDALLNSGKAQKGDIIYCEPNWGWPGADCHIGIFWGDYSSQNKFWHSTFRGNHISNIYSGTPVETYYLVKTD